MEIKISTNHILLFLLMISSLIFVGVCIEAGGFIYNTIHVMFINPNWAGHFWNGNDFSALYAFDKGQFLVQAGFMCLVSILRAILFYLIIKLLMEKKLDMVKPFSPAMKRFIFSVAYLSLGIGIFSHWGMKYATWLSTQVGKMPSAEQMRLGGSDVWFFMGVVLLVIAQIFKRGHEIQSENDLTV